MRTPAGSLIALGIALFLAGQANANLDVLCEVCTCEDGTVVCLDAEADTVDELGVCGAVCSNAGSSFESRTLSPFECEDLPACDHAQTPAASPLWLSVGTLALVFLGGATMRRTRAQAGH